MPLPPFDMNGLLPPFLGGEAITGDRSPYEINMGELVTGLGTTDHRRKMLKNLIHYRALLAGEGYTNGVQFIDGSFVEDVERVPSRTPQDIDVFNLLFVPLKYHNDMPHWHSKGFPFWQNEVVDSEKNKARFNLDTYGELFENLGANDLIKSVIYWYGLFSHQRSTRAWKGFAMLQLDPAADKAALSLLGGA